MRINMHKSRFFWHKTFCSARAANTATMAGAKKGGKKVVKKLDGPIVTPAELKRATEDLNNREEQRKAKSRMSYYLERKGLTATYDSSNIEVRKEYFKQWHAQWLIENKPEVEITAAQTNTLRTKNRSEKEWLNKHQLTVLYGPEKAANKMAVLQHQPDPDTGLDGEWDREYKNSNEKRFEDEDESRSKCLSASKTIEGEAQLQEAQSMMNDVSACFESTASSSAEHVADPGGGAKIAEADTVAVSQTAKKLMGDSKTVLTTAHTTLIELKEMFSATENNKLCANANEEVGKLCKKFVIMISKMEKFHHTKGESNAALAEALAPKIDELYDEFNTYSDWVGKVTGFVPTGAKVKRKRT